MNAEAISKLKEELLTCNICENEAFFDGTDFHALPCPCQQTLCESCLQNIVKKTKRHSKPLCPWCRQEFSLLENGKLPTLRYAMRLADKLKSSSRKTKAQVKEVSRSPQSKAIKAKGTDKKLCLKKLTNLPPNLNVLCAGTKGIFYGRLSHEPGMVQIDAMNGTLLRFGNTKSFYHGMTFYDNELYVVNATQFHIEVYKHSKFIRSWHCGIESSSYLHLQLSPSGRLAFWSSSCLIPFTRYGKTFLVSNQAKSDEFLIKLLRDAAVMTTFSNSIWLLSNQDYHLWEIPMDQRLDSVSYKQPIQHLKVGKFSRSFHWGQDRILFLTGELVKMIDLKAIREQGTDVKPTINSTINDTCKGTHHAMISNCGYMMTQKQDGCLSLYKLLQPECKAEAVEVACDAGDGPEYKSFKELVRMKAESLEQATYSRIGKLVSNIIWFTLFLLLILLILWYKNMLANSLQFVEESVREVCQHFPRLRRCYGWSYFYISMCKSLRY